LSLRTASISAIGTCSEHLARFPSSQSNFMVVCTQMRVQINDGRKWSAGSLEIALLGRRVFRGQRFAPNMWTGRFRSGQQTPRGNHLRKRERFRFVARFEERRGRLAMRSRNGRVELYASSHVEAAADDNRFPGGEYGHLVQKPPRLDRNYKLVRRWLAGSRSTIRRLTLESAARFLSLSVRPADY
jgi:hypothetical protein